MSLGQVEALSQDARFPPFLDVLVFSNGPDVRAFDEPLGRVEGWFKL
jgi:hypothetical protein